MEEMASEIIDRNRTDKLLFAEYQEENEVDEQWNIRDRKEDALTSENIREHRRALRVQYEKAVLEEYRDDIVYYIIK